MASLSRAERREKQKLLEEVKGDPVEKLQPLQKKKSVIIKFAERPGGINRPFQQVPVSVG